MSNVVELCERAPAGEWRTRSERAVHRIEREPCEIVIFPGVRYERWTSDNPPAPTPEPAPSKKRGRRKA
jgi:hypothetical protein